MIFTPRGQMLRNPDFGTNLVSYIFGQKDDDTYSQIKSEITSQINKYVPSVVFEDLNVYEDEESENGIIVSITYSVKIGNKTEETTVAVKL